MEKTIKEWLETLPEPYRTEALENADKDTLIINKTHLSRAIRGSFYWEYSPQGHDYWKNVFTRAEAGEFNNLLLDKDSEK